MNHANVANRLRETIAILEEAHQKEIDDLPTLGYTLRSMWGISGAFCELGDDILTIIDDMIEPLTEATSLPEIIQRFKTLYEKQKQLDYEKWLMINSKKYPDIDKTIKELAKFYQMFNNINLQNLLSMTTYADYITKIALTKNIIMDCPNDLLYLMIEKIAPSLVIKDKQSALDYLDEQLVKLSIMKPTPVTSLNQVGSDKASSITDNHHSEKESMTKKQVDNFFNSIAQLADATKYNTKKQYLDNIKEAIKSAKLKNLSPNNPTILVNNTKIRLTPRLKAIFDTINDDEMHFDGKIAKIKTIMADESNWFLTFFRSNETQALYDKINNLLQSIAKVDQPATNKSITLYHKVADDHLHLFQTHRPLPRKNKVEAKVSDQSNQKPKSGT